MRNRSEGVPAFLSMLVYCFCTTLLPPHVSGQVAVVVPLEEATFEAPALAPPLWLTNDLVMHHIALLTLYTLQDKQVDAGLPLAPRRPRVTLIGSYARVSGDFGSITLQDNLFGNPAVVRDFDYDGNAFGVALQLEWQVMPWSFGLIIPYQHLDLDSFDADRIGGIGFARYDLYLSNKLFLRFALNGTYMFNDIDSDVSARSFDDFNTLGGNASVAVGFDTKELQQAVTIRGGWLADVAFSGSIALSYQIQRDDAQRESIEGATIVNEVEVQQLLMLGGNVGARIGRRLAVGGFAVWNYDASEYDGSLDDVDKDYVDLGVELAWSFLPRWRLHGRYKKVLGYDEVDVDHISLGVSLRL